MAERRPFIRSSTVLLALLLLPSGSCGAQETRTTDAASAYSGPTAPVRETNRCKIERIVDGDTVVCRGQGRVRLIGVDTPELSQEPYGRLAARALAKLVPVGIDVELEPDIERRDQHGRLLAYVWAEGRLVNWLLVRQGWAVVLTYPPNVQYVDEFTEAQEAARRDRAGLWAQDGLDCLPIEHRQGRCD